MSTYLYLKHSEGQPEVTIYTTFILRKAVCFYCCILLQSHNSF